MVVPTRNEADNIGALLAGLGPVLAPLHAEIVVVDDSDDETPAELTRHATTVPVPVRLLRRPPGRRAGGLSGAVIAGLREARGKWVLVMDADLQHPPAAAAVLAHTALRHDVDLIIGTRYAGSGCGGGLNGPSRTAVSSWATWLVKGLFPRSLATVSDPMSGLFAVRRDAIDADRLRPVGFKILLELLVRNRQLRVAEVAYTMDQRHAGTSKASVREGMAFLRHLARLRAHRLVGQVRQRPPQSRARELARMIGFGLVGVSGIAVNTLALWFAFHISGLHYLLGAALATQVSTTWNFLLIDTLIYRRARTGSWPGRAARFFTLNNLLLLLRLPVLHLLVFTGVGVLTANAVTLAALFLVRFVASDRIIFNSATSGSRDPVRLLVDPAPVPRPIEPASRRRYQYLQYRYDVAGVVTIGSQIMLPELEFFRAQWVGDRDVDIAIRVGDVGGRSPRRRAALTEYATDSVLRYEEHLGRLGANFRVELGDPITIEVGPLLAHSPHVVYTNIVEALLRFVMVSRGRMLLHSACVSLDGVGVMLSARTDTGKTATVLRLLREHGGHFLSDDMTVVDATGGAVCFPKPLTISAHTLRAVDARDLTKGEWRRLALQSRLHSRGGRSFALTLSRFNLPIMGINAVVQALIPPPKYSADRLVSCRMGTATQVEQLFIIERGSPKISELTHADTVERMIVNTDDAYGFPPFRYLAPAITLRGQNYVQLRERERQILSGFLTNVRSRVIASDCYGWADEIPRLLDGERLLAGARPGHGAGGAAPRLHAWPCWEPTVATNGVLV